MAVEESLVLHMPFDEMDGATTTYDYSKNRADGVVTDAHFESGKIVTALDLMATESVR